jgi:cytochrome P450
MPENTKKYRLPKGYSLFQTTLNSPEFLNNPVKFILKSMDHFGSTYSATLGPKRKLIITRDPAFISHVLKDNHKNYRKSALSTEQAVRFFGNGLLFSNGDYWLRQRRLIQPAFHREKIEGLYGIVTTAINDFTASFPQGENIDIYPLVHQLSFGTVIKSLFDIKLSPGMMTELSSLFLVLQTFLIKDVNQPWRKFTYPFTGEEKRNLAKARRVRDIFVNIIRERRAGNKSYHDLLDMLLNSRYEDTGEPMTDEQITDEVLIIIFAGHETTANTLAWALHLLSLNESIVQKLRLQFKGHTIYESMHNEYLKATLNETMRLYPAAWMTERAAIADDVFGEFSFPKNTIIISFFYGLHMDKNLWEDASQFKPERFIEGDKPVKTGNYFPFGAGPRMCIGNNFAMAEMCFFLFAFLSRFQITATAHVPEMKALITLRPDKVILNIKRLPEEPV